MLKNLLLTILLFSGFNAFSQAHFEGIVTYEMQLADRNSADVSDETGGSDHLIPKEFKLYINGNRTRLEINAGKSVVTLLSSAADSTYTLLQNMGRTIALRNESVQIKAKTVRLNRFRVG